MTCIQHAHYHNTWQTMGAYIVWCMLYTMAVHCILYAAMSRINNTNRSNFGSCTLPQLLKPNTPISLNKNRITCFQPPNILIYIFSILSRLQISIPNWATQNLNWRFLTWMNWCKTRLRLNADVYAYVYVHIHSYITPLIEHTPSLKHTHTHLGEQTHLLSTCWGNAIPPS